MKLLTSLLIFLIITGTISGQSMDTIIQKLVNVKLISKKQEKEFKEYLSWQDEKNNAAYLNAVFQCEFKKESGHLYSPFGVILSFDKDKPKPSEQQKINQELLNYLGKLQTCGLVTSKQFKSQSEKINNNNYVHLFQLLPDLSNQSAYEECLQTEKIKRYAEKLLANRIVTERQFEKLINDSKEEKLTSHYELITYCKNALFFDLAKYSNDPAVYLEQIHREVSVLLPQLAFTNFKYKIEIDFVDSSINFTSYYVIVSLKANNKIYKQKSFISLDKIGKDGNYLGKIDGQQFYQIFNKILADDQSPLRLHQIEPALKYGDTSSYQYFGIIALEKNQPEMFQYSNSYLKASYENFKNTLTTDKIDAAINEYKQLGLLNHLTQEEIERAKEKVKEQEIRNFNDVIACFHSVVHLFDTELSNLEDPYAELVKEFSNISHQKFNPTNISDNFDIEKNKKVTLKFNLNGKNYQKVLKLDRDWIDTDFFTFIDSVIKEIKIDGKFYGLYTGGQEVCIIYLTQQQYDYLKKYKLLIFSDEWETEME